ncbi:hypothetical protein [Actinoplanes solisilvae]|uniref:hypothetical protein n=1 Tax=Actinoplanes solisilvae TaxID=2486853 RepID=UPI000FD6E7A0|nr:hypothetical protein [Actinoplanes solisilvae]
MFRLPAGAQRRASFRLQLFTASGARPVAIATQVPGADEGASLTNVAEACASAVWERFFATDAEPPIWIQQVIIDDRRHLTLVEFTADGAQRSVRRPRWRPLSSSDVETLVGRPVSLERGEGFVAVEPEPEPESEYGAALVALLPRPEPFRVDDCMSAGVAWWRRLGRQVVPRRGGRGCCWYHGGDWHVVSRVALRLTEKAHAAGVAFAGTVSYVMAQPDATALTGWEREALSSLLADTIRPDGRWPSGEGYNNGQHRAQAMIEAGVRWTLVEHTVG